MHCRSGEFFVAKTRLAKKIFRIPGETAQDYAEALKGVSDLINSLILLRYAIEPLSSTDQEHIATKQHQLLESGQTQNPLPAVRLQKGCNQYRLPSGKGKLADRMLRK